MSTSVGVSIGESALVRKSIADVTRRKGRTLIVVLSIFIGVFGLTGINTFELKIFDVFALLQNHSRYPDITFQVSRFDPALTNQLASIPNVQISQAQMMGKLQWQTDAGPITMNITAFQDPQHSDLGAFRLASGHYPGPGEVIMETISNAVHSFALNDLIQVQGPHGLTRLRIVGTSVTPGVPVSKHFVQAYMSMGGLGQLLGTTTMNSIAIKVHDINTVRDTITTITRKLQAQHITMSNLTSTTSIAEQLGSSIVTGVFNIIRVLASGAILVSCLLIINTLTTLISEQMKVIGTMKAIGGTRGAIFRSYFITVFIYSVLGTMLGLGLGIAAGYETAIQFARIKSWDLGPFSLEPNIFIIGLAAGIVVPLLASLLPLLDGTRISVHAAMSGYGIADGDSISTSRWQRLIAERLIRVPQTVWLGLRGTFRKRSRAIGTIAALTVAGTTFLAILSVVYSIDQMIIHNYDSFDMDVIVNVKSQPFAPLRQQVDALPNVRQVERVAVSRTAVVSKWGQMTIYGLDANTQLYRKQLSSGRWFTPGERNVIVLSNNFLHQSGLTLGDTLTLTSTTGDAATWTIIGSVNDPNGSLESNGMVITSAENMNHFVGDPESNASLLLIQASDRSPSAINQLVRQLNQSLHSQGTFSAISVQQQIAASEQSAFGLFFVFYVTAVGVGLAGILGLYNTLMSSVLERRREIGIWRSMGANNWQVALVFWIEGLSLALFAWLFAAIIGIPASYGFVSLVSQWLFHVPFSFNGWSLLEMLLAMLIIATLACLVPATRAGRVRIAEILRYE